MSRTAVRLTDAAIADFLEQADWYEEQSGRDLAKRWENSVTTALLGIIRRPQAGTRCTFGATELRGIRRASIPTFSNHLIFYRVEESTVLILRILHGSRDLETLL